MTDSEAYRKLEAKYYMQVVRRMPPVITKGEGTRVWDADGKEYLDFTAGWAVLNLGHSHPTVTSAIQNQASEILQMTNLFYTVPQLALAETLVENSCVDKFFFCNSGAEANEGASKLARKWGRERLNGAYEIITAVNSFHGRTLGMMAATGQKSYQDKWQPLTPGFINVPYNDADAVKEATTDKTCAVLLEPVQGEGGVVIPSENYLYQVQEWCRAGGILFMLDEVQTGMGRLGSMFGYQMFEGVEPDVITLGKALGGGTPLGAFGAKDQCALLEPGDHGSTFGGNALTTAAGAAAAKELVEKRVPEMARETGALLMGRLASIKEKCNLVTDVRGMGLLIAVEFSKEVAADISRSAMDMGLICNAVRPNAIRLMPPLNVTRDEIEQALNILDKVLEQMADAHNG